MKFLMKLGKRVYGVIKGLLDFMLWSDSKLMSMQRRLNFDPEINPRLTKGVVTTPDRFFPDTLKRSIFTQNDFLIAVRASFAVILMQKRGV